MSRNLAPSSARIVEEHCQQLGGSYDSYLHRHAIPKEHYFRMVEGRYMSLLSSFADHELRAGLAEMAERYADRKILAFTDRFDFITAIKH
jgi:hypothetical protein